MQFLFDFGSPNAYFCHKVIQAVEARTEARFEYVPILLDGLLKLSAAQESGCGPVYVDVPRADASKARNSASSRWIPA